MKEIAKIEMRHVVASYMSANPKGSSPIFRQLIIVPAPSGPGVNVYGTAGHYVHAGTDQAGWVDGAALGLQLPLIGELSDKFKRSRACTVYQVDGYRGLIEADNGEAVAVKLSEASDDADQIVSVITSAMRYHTDDPRIV